MTYRWWSLRIQGGNINSSQSRIQALLSQVGSAVDKITVNFHQSTSKKQKGRVRDVIFNSYSSGQVYRVVKYSSTLVNGISFYILAYNKLPCIPKKLFQVQKGRILHSKPERTNPIHPPSP